MIDKFTFEEQVFLRGIKILNKKEVIEKIQELEIDDNFKELEDFKINLIRKLNKLNQDEIEELLMSV